MRSDHNLGDACQESREDVGVVVADTSPLNYLVQIRLEELLPGLYNRVIVPSSVIAELGHNRTPPMVSLWASRPPSWLEILSPVAVPDADLSRLGPGERDAIQLAGEMRALLVIIDELKGKRVARSRGLSVIGTLGILLEAHQAGIADARDGLDRLIRETTFRISDRLKQEFLTSLGDRA